MPGTPVERERPRLGRPSSSRALGFGARRIAGQGPPQADTLPGLVAVYEDKPAGSITYQIDGAQCEIVSLNSLVEGMGIGIELEMLL